MNNPALSPSLDGGLDNQIPPSQEIPGQKRIAVTDFRSVNRFTNPLSAIDLFLKRATDIIIGSIAFLVFLPVMLITALAIRVTSEGPVIFRQIRTGQNRKPIVVFKFRSMTHSTEKEFRQAVRSDPRITPLGNFLRRTSLDELPQLINVINGSMSLVGPRPHPLKLDEEFSYVIQSLPSRYRIKPGITGLAQIRGHRGETRCVNSMKARLELDKQYIESWNLLQDFWILAQTAVIGWVNKNAY